MAAFIIRWELFWLMLVAPFLLFPGERRGVALVILPLLWGTRWVARGHFIQRTPVDWSVLLLMVMVLVSFCVSIDLELSLPKETGVLLGIAFFYALVERAGQPHALGLALGLLVLVCCTIAGISLFVTSWKAEIAIFAPVIDTLPRYALGLPGIEATGVNPNIVAGTLLFVFPLLVVLIWPFYNVTLALVSGRWGWFVYTLLGFASVLVGAVLLLSQSRGGYVGLGVGILALVVLPHRRWLLFSLMGGLLGVGLLLGRVGPEPFEHYLTTQITEPSGLASTLEGRLRVWWLALRGLRDVPLTGMGMGTFRYMAERYPIEALRGEKEFISHAHNHLLSAAVDLGVPGLVAYSALWLGAGVMCWQSWCRVQARPLRLLVLGLAASLAAQFTWSLTDTNALGAKADFPFWVVFAAVVLLHATVVGRPPDLMEGSQVETPGSQAGVD